MSDSWVCWYTLESSHKVQWLLDWSSTSPNDILLNNLLLGTHLKDMFILGFCPDVSVTESRESIVTPSLLGDGAVHLVCLARSSSWWWNNPSESEKSYSSWIIKKQQKNAISNHHPVFVWNSTYPWSLSLYCVRNNNFGDGVVYAFQAYIGNSLNYIGFILTRTL